MRTGASVYHRADGRWEARYQKSRDENGKIIYGFVYGATQEEAEKKRSEILLQNYKEAVKTNSPLPSINPNVPSMSGVNRQEPIKLGEKYVEPLTDETIDILDICLDETDELMKIAFYLSLHMGFSVQEITALKYGCIDMEQNVIHVESAIHFKKHIPFETPTNKRTVFIPPYVREWLELQVITEKNPDHYIMTDSEKPVESNQSISSSFRKIIRSRLDVKAIRTNVLRPTFIRTCLEANMNIESVSLITGMDKALLYRYYGKFITADPTAIIRTDRPKPEQKPECVESAPIEKHLNLLILGAGSHGHNVLETVEKLDVFHDIRFLDDKATGGNIIGTCDDSAALVEDYPCAFVAIGNNERRKELADKLRAEGYILPRIIHPNATISQNAVIGDGTIVLAQATVDAATVGEMCIVASNALVSRGSTVGDFCHIDCGGIVLKDACVDDLVMVESGQIYR